jgi:hypothetical protein
MNRPLRAALDALQFPQGDPTKLRSLTEPEWSQLLRLADPAHLTLTLHALCPGAFPPAVQSRLEENVRNNAQKFARLKSEFHEIASTLTAQNLEFIVLKGFTHSPDFTPDPLWRAQSDLDLWLQPGQVHAAYDALRALGYVPASDTEGRHLPPLVRSTDFTWRGDFFDPTIPIPVDLHYRLWDGELERIPAPGLDAFWPRRQARLIDERPIQVLHPADSLAFAALHHLLHVLRGDARLQRAWEIAAFLHRRSADSAFWSQWRDLHPTPLRRLEAVALHLSATWFNAPLPPAVHDELDRLPPRVKHWFARHAWAPVENLITPNKHELWLHLSLIDSPAAQAAVFRRRVFPTKSLTAPEAHAGSTLSTLRHRAARLAHHARTLPATLREAACWLSRH